MALYRKYRPASFAELVGQEQVTTPLSAALDAGRINHAYLFSGPRGCGKTSSARIMARSLNCVEGPTSTPCGKCPSCVSLAPGGPGNLDVTELDAASHNGVDDMRELRDRAYYAPAESRYRVFIIDEAHMISSSGANALLKIVEEPPEHLIFIFATTEPDKIIGTIRSRTHHYPFRLLTPPAMKGLLERTVAAEGVQVEDSVYPLVIQAGGGSPRDTLSILDQMLAGAGEQGLTYELARPLLGVTDLTLLDDTVAALAAGDKPELFRIVDRVIEAGHEPKRFAADLLDRMRDLMVLQAVPSAFSDGLVDAPTNRAEVLAAQAQQFSGPQLTQYASVVSAEIPNLRGATSPRLLLEVLCARLLVSAPPAPGPVGATNAAAVPGAPGQTQATQQAPQGGVSGAAAAAAKIAEMQERRRAQAKPEAKAEPEPQRQPAPEREPERETERQLESEPERTSEPQGASESAGDLVETLRKDWAQVRADIGAKNKVAAIMLAEARVLGIKDGTLYLGHNTGALAERLNAPGHNDTIRKVLEERFSTSLPVQVTVGTDPQAMGFSPKKAPQTWNPGQQAPQAAPAAPQAAPRETADDEQEPESPGTDDGWGAPRKIAGTEERAPETAPAPVVPERPASASASGGARAAAERAMALARQRQAEQATHSFSDGVPLPPEPDEPDMPDVPVDEPAAAPVAAPVVEGTPVARASESTANWNEEEEMMADAAQEPGERDRRNSMEVAMELLTQELGARRL
ncbi:DNA polymerase III subunit gamma and tau [Corynebacterium incognita]|uniref:DNA polymerase III subunit gamma/tau n=1 Tax=Corynebacterium incognita TaxID=2754725 RepID=A0A7G7CMC7_9CORY|nr:DNA polymerase III subunit gamma and tau [Corynebacterium incognita]QNE88743.1 DNA polymerase III subunit gamma and tau [Corynebacterium incognita]